jgi:nitroimidazol reductase NimA-like FMN-containing flavoprotein (pyridoxamine 5'-phosphate oxidase superfamily)
MKNYDNSRVRRQDRLLSEESADELLKDGRYGVLSMTRPDGTAYGVPISYVVDHDTIFMHCAPEGEKLRCLRAHPEVSFCVVGHTQVIPDHFTTEYQSVIVRGHASLVVDDDARRRVLALILDKYSHDYKALGMTYAEKSLPRTAILRLDVTTISGKAKMLKK